MITKAQGYDGYVGLSTDPKPTSVENGSQFFEMDTQKQYMFNAEDQEWLEQSSAGGGGGSTGGGLVVTIVGAFNQPAPDNAKFDKTAGEIISALEGNGSVRFVWHDPEAEDAEYTTIYYLDDYGVDSDGVGFTLRAFNRGVQNSYWMSATSLDDYPQFYI